MKVSFMKLWDNISQLKENKHIETPAMQAIRAGVNIDPNFWDNFILICNNAESVADLLDVNVDQIVNWPNKIKQTKELVDKNKKSEDVKTNVISTGDIE